MNMDQFPPRPSITQDMVKEAFSKYVENNPDWLDGSDVESCANWFKEEFSQYRDGFEIAKKLDSHHGWNTTREDVDAFDEIIYLVDLKLREEEKKWVEDNNIGQPLPSGTRVRCVSRDKTGVIEGTFSHSPGSYKIIPDVIEINPTTRWICQFERVEVVDER